MTSRVYVLKWHRGALNLNAMSRAIPVFSSSRVPSSRTVDAKVEAAYRDHHERIYRFCLVELRDRMDAEDATHAVFESLLKTYRRGVGLSAEEEMAWLYKAAHHTCVDVVRRRNRWGHLVQRAILQHFGGEDDVEAWVELREVLSSIASLPDPVPHLVALRLSGLRWKEVALISGREESAVRMSVTRALKGIAHQYQGASDG